MKKLLAVVAAIWLMLMPPLFTGGECTQEFDHEQARVDREHVAIRGVKQAVGYWNARGILARVVSLDQCRRARPRDLQSCGDGPFVQAAVPVKNVVCRIYRDDEIRVRFFFDEHERMERLTVDMSPFYSLPLPGFTLHWAR